jgi:heat shock protein HtpX
MAAYGLYTHIQSNKRRSVALLIGLFFLVYLLVYAGALVGKPSGRMIHPIFSFAAR